jgi:hypothetical protein
VHIDEACIQKIQLPLVYFTSVKSTILLQPCPGGGMMGNGTYEHQASSIFILYTWLIVYQDLLTVPIYLGAGFGLSLTLNLEEYENIEGVSTLTGIKVCAQYLFIVNA